MAAKKFLLCFHDMNVWNYKAILPLLEGLKDLAGGPFSILIIPSTEGAKEEAIAGFKEAIAKLANDGYELALHGYKHKAEFSQGRSYRGLFEMNITHQEAEFAGLSQSESKRLLMQSIEAWNQLFEPGCSPKPAAFIPPTWWSNPFLQMQVRKEGMVYEDRFSMTTKKGMRYASPVTSFAGISDLATGPMFNVGELSMKVPFGVPRIAVHPGDFPKFRSRIRHLIRTALGNGRVLAHYRDL